MRRENKSWSVSDAWRFYSIEAGLREAEILNKAYKRLDELHEEDHINIMSPDSFRQSNGAVSGYYRIATKFISESVDEIQFS